MWEIIKNPSKELLDALWAVRVEQAVGSICSDCGVAPGKPHVDGCDVARCLACGGQRLSCDCSGDKGGGDIWDGMWPGTRECYELGLVCRWVDGDGLASEPSFDYNQLAARGVDRRVRGGSS